MSDVYKTAIVALMTGAFATAGTLYVSTFDYFNRSRELDIKMVDVSLAILRGEKGEGEKKQSKMARTFALRALRQYSGVELSDVELKNWANSGENLQFREISIIDAQAAIDELGEEFLQSTDAFMRAYGIPKKASPPRESTILDSVQECESKKGVFAYGKFLECYVDTKNKAGEN